MIQNCASEFQNTVPIILEIWIYVRISKYSITAILESRVYQNRASVKTARAKFEILFGNHGNMDLLEQENNHIEMLCSLLSAWPAFGVP